MATSNAYKLAQSAMADLKAAIYQVLAEAPESGLSNAEIGRPLGIYADHAGHEGHIPRPLLSIMSAEGVVSQDEITKRWALSEHGPAA